MFVISVATVADDNNDHDNKNNNDHGNNDNDFDFFNFLLQAGNQRICMQIANARGFDDHLTVIGLRGIPLLSNDMEHLIQFLTQSPHQERKEVDLCGCNIGDSGIALFHRGLTEHNITIKRLSISNNNLTESSSCKVYEIAIHCKVQVLALRHNPAIGKDPKIYSIISDPDSLVEELNMSHTNSKQVSTATELFSELAKNKKKKLRVLWINNNNLTDHDCSAIVKAIRNNTSLTELIMHRNQFSVTSALQIIQALAHNNTLQSLTLPWYETNNQEKIIESAKQVEESRYCRIEIYSRKF